MEHRTNVAVLPTPDGTTALVSPQKLKAEILAYHDEWYGGWPK
jgi:hypothetical protein